MDSSLNVDYKIVKIYYFYFIFVDFNYTFLSTPGHATSKSGNTSHSSL